MTVSIKNKRKLPTAKIMEQIKTGLEQLASQYRFVIETLETPRNNGDTINLLLRTEKGEVKACFVVNPLKDYATEGTIIFPDTISFQDEMAEVLSRCCN